MTAVPFDTLRLARQLRENAGFTPEHAEAAAEALSEAVGGADLATKTDIQDVGRLLDEVRRSLEGQIRESEQRVVIRFGGMLVVFAGIFLTALHFMLPH